MEVVSMSKIGAVCEMTVKQRGVLMDVLGFSKPDWSEYLIIRSIRAKVALTEAERDEHLEVRDNQMVIKNDGYVAPIGFTPGEYVLLTKVLKSEVARVSKLDNAVGYLDELYPVIEALGIEVS